MIGMDHSEKIIKLLIHRNNRHGNHSGLIKKVKLNPNSIQQK